jgi:hypothetical protein
MGYAPSSEHQLLLLFADPFERLTVRFLVHEPPGFPVPFRPALGHWIEDLGTTSDSSIAVTISSRGIRSHTPPLGMKKYAMSPSCLTGSSTPRLYEFFLVAANCNKE